MNTRNNHSANALCTNDHGTSCSPICSSTSNTTVHMNVAILNQFPKGLMHAMRCMFSLLLVVSLAACGGGAASSGEEGHGEEEEGHGHGGHNEHLGESPEVTAAQFAAIDGQLGRVELKDLSTSLQATGFLKVPPQNIADVSAAVPATVREVLVQEGDQVRKGQMLVTIADQAITQLQRDYLDARARLTYATADLERQTELAKNNVSAQKTLQQATAEHAGLQAEVNADAQVLRLWGLDPEKLTADGIRSAIGVPSPIDGMVAHIAVNVGSRVGGEAPMVRVVNNSELHVDVFVYEQDITHVKKGQRIDLTLTNVPGRSYTAEVFAIGSAFESETKTLPVHAKITGDKSGLIDGMGVTAMIDIGNARVPAVPTQAIVSNDGQDYVFLHTEAEEGDGHGSESRSSAGGHAHAEAHDHAAEGTKHNDDEAHDHEKEEGHAHAGEDDHDHAKEGSAHSANEGHEHSGNMHFQRVAVKRGVTRDGFTAITFLQTVPPDAEVVVGGAYYLMAMMTNSGEHSH